ncbi:hypothetical protein SADUNF_Sadunf16G0085600 [Salix dunnii]|uniref:Uncharacterized protein n=1 Tax=Salix dunnii TaxID=1413687 RepID=A0A835J5R9_9ROSI|nr:hypothetical protein SADUNF_Sadunf16G0085600 [Salix dunnii]
MVPFSRMISPLIHLPPYWLRSKWTAIFKSVERQLESTFGKDTSSSTKTTDLFMKGKTPITEDFSRATKMGVTWRKSVTFNMFHQDLVSFPFDYVLNLVRLGRFSFLGSAKLGFSTSAFSSFVGDRFCFNVEVKMREMGKIDVVLKSLFHTSLRPRVDLSNGITHTNNHKNSKDETREGQALMGHNLRIQLQELLLGHSATYSWEDCHPATY